MTKQEARKFFGISDKDEIVRTGVLQIKKNVEEQLKVWSLSSFQKEKLEKELEACEALLSQQKEKNDCMKGMIREC